MYTKLEYEHLAMETHVTCKNKTTRKLIEVQLLFVYICCNFPAKNKNGLSWHYVTSECKRYIKDAFMKMYLT